MYWNIIPQKCEASSEKELIKQAIDKSKNLNELLAVALVYYTKSE